MPTASLSVSTHINTKPEMAFAYVADLTKHSDWSANSLSIKVVAVSPTIIGREYRSTAVVRGISFTADLRVTDYQPPARFAFNGHDSTGKFLHRFTFTPSNNGTKVVREIHFTLTLRQWLVFLVLYLPVRRPAAKKALRLLKQRLDQRRLHLDR